MGVDFSKLKKHKKYQEDFGKEIDNSKPIATNIVDRVNQRAENIMNQSTFRSMSIGNMMNYMAQSKGKTFAKKNSNDSENRIKPVEILAIKDEVKPKRNIVDSVKQRVIDMNNQRMANNLSTTNLRTQNSIINNSYLIDRMTQKAYNKEQEEKERKQQAKTPLEYAQEMKTADTISKAQPKAKDIDNKTIVKIANINNKLERDRIISGLVKSKKEQERLGLKVNEYVQEREIQEEANKINERINNGNTYTVLGETAKRGFSSVGAGTLNYGLNIAGTMNSLLPTNSKQFEDENTFVNATKQMISKNQQLNAKIDNKLVKSVGKAGETIGFMIPSIATSLIAPEINAGNIVNAVGVGSSSYLENLDEEQSNKLESLLTGATKGTVSYKIEKLTDGNFLSKGKSSLSKEQIKDLSNISRNTVRWLQSKANEFGGEIAEENLENVAGYMIDYVINNKKVSLDEMIADAKETSVDTFNTTLLLNVLGLGGKTYKESKQYETSRDLLFNTNLDNASKNIILKEVLEGKVTSNDVQELIKGKSNTELNNKIIDNSELDNDIKETMKKISEKNELGINEIQYLIDNTKNGKYEQNQPMTMQNNELLENNQQTTQEQGQMAEKELSEETRQIVTNLMKSIDNYNNTRQEGQEIFDINNEETKKEIQSIQKVAEDRGIQIEFNENSFNNNTDNAFYEYDDNGNVAKIVLNPNTTSKKYIQNLAVHELVHSFSGDKKTNLMNEVINYAKTLPGYDKAYQDIQSKYQEKYGQNVSEDVINEEVVANILGEKLGDKQFVNDLVNGNYANQNKNWVQKIYDFVKNQINRFKGYKDQEQYWTHIKEMFDDAYRNSDINKEGLKNSIEFDVTGNENLDKSGTLFFRKEKEDGRYYVTATDTSGKIIYDGRFTDLDSMTKTLGKDIAEHILNNSEDTNNEIYITNKGKPEDDYKMSHRPSEEYGNASNFEDNMPKVFENPQWYMNMKKDYNLESLEALRKVRNNPEAEITIYRATPGDKINYGDWVTPSKKYAEFHNESQLDGKGNILELITKAKDILWGGDDINEFGYYPIQENIDDNEKILYNNLDLSKAEPGDLKNEFYKALTPKQWTKYHKKMNEVMGKTYGYFNRTDIIDNKIITTELQNGNEQVTEVLKLKNKSKMINQIIEEANNYGYDRTELYEALKKMYGEENVYRYDNTDGKYKLPRGKESNSYDRGIDENSRQINGEANETKIIRSSSRKVKNSNKGSFSLDTTGAWNNFIEKNFKNEGEGTSIKDLKKLPEMSIDKYKEVLNTMKNIPQVEKNNMLKDIEGIKRNKQSFDEYKQYAEELNKNYAEYNKSQEEDMFKNKGYKERQDLISQKRKEFNKSMEYDDSVVAELDEIIPRNRNGKRTVKQWKDMAKQLGQRIADLSPEQIEDIAVKSYLDLEPTKAITKYDNQAKTNVGYESLYANDWINSVYEGVRENRQYSMDTENQEIEQPNQEPKLPQSQNLKMGSEEEKTDNEAKIVDTVYKEEINEGKTRKHYKSIYESDQIGKVGKEVAKELYKTDTYTPISNVETMSKTNENIKRNGVERTYESFMNKIGTNERVTLQDIATGERLIQIYSQNGEYNKVNDLIQNVAILGTELGQQVQALSLIKKASPEGQLQFLNKIVDRTNVKENTNLKVTDDMAKKILDSKNQNELQQNVSEVAEQLANELPITMKDKIRSWRYLSMLGNPRTHIRNLGANVVMNVTQNIKNGVAGAGEDLASIFNDKFERTKTLKRSNKDQKTFAKNDAEVMQDLIDGGGKYDIQNIIQSNKRSFDNKTLNKIAEFNTNLLDIEDKIFLKTAYKQALQNYMTANNLSSKDMTGQTLQKAREYASLQAQEATFHQFSSLANSLSAIENKGGVLGKTFEAILPFKKTPINIAKTGLEYSPIGLAKSLTGTISDITKTTQDYKTKLDEGKITKEEYKTATSKLITDRIDQMSKGLTGTSIALIGYALAQAGVLKAGNDDEKDEFEKELGNQEYAITIGDNTYTLDWLSPSAIPLFTGATIYNLLNGNGDKEDKKTLNSLATGFAKAFEPMTEMSMLQGLTSAISSYEKGSNMFFDLGASMGTSYAGQFIPTALGQVAKTIDPYVRDTTSTETGLAKKVDQFKRQSMSKIPGLSQMLPIKQDIWGNDKTKADNIIQRYLENAILPYSRQKLIKDVTDAELENVFENTGEKSVLPTRPQKYLSINGEKINLTSDEYAKAKKQFGNTSKNILNELTKSKEYKELDNVEKADAIKEVYSYVKEELKSSFSDNYTSKKLDKYENYKILNNNKDIDKFITFELKNFESDKDSNGESITGSKADKIKDYLKTTGLDEGIQAYLFTTKSNNKLDNQQKEAFDKYVNNLKLTDSERKKIYLSLGTNNIVQKQDGNIRWK